MEYPPSRLWPQLESSLVTGHPTVSTVAVFHCQVYFKRYGFPHLKKEGLQKQDFTLSLVYLTREKEVDNEGEKPLKHKKNKTNVNKIQHFTKQDEYI